MSSVLKRILLVSLAIAFPAISLLCLLFRGALHLWLRVRHGTTFGGLMDGFDTVWDVRDATSRGQITILGTFDCPDDALHSEDVHSVFERHIRQPEVRRACHKAAMRRRRLLGYNYYVEADPYQGLIHRLPVDAYNNMEDIKKLLAIAAQTPIGERDDKMLEFWIGGKAIKCKDAHRMEYPIIMKMHHSLGDGIALMNFCIAGLGKEPAKFLRKSDENLKKMLNPSSRKQDVEEEKKPFWRKYGIYHSLFGRPDANLLHGRPLSGRKNLVWSCGDGDGSDDRYVRMVKRIKSRLGVTFNNVLFTALAASFSAYYQKHDPHNVPAYITNAIVVLPSAPKFEDVVRIVDDRVEAVDLSNKFIIAFLRLPLVTAGDVSQQLMSLVERIKHEIHALTHSIDLYLIIFFMKYFAYIMPLPIVQFIMSYFDSTLSVSNLPGHERLQMFHGGHINDLYFWIPNVKQIGLGISLFTYADCLRIGLIADEALVPDAGEAQAIVDGVFKYLAALDVQTTNNNNNNNSDNIHSDKIDYELINVSNSITK